VQKYEYNDSHAKFTLLVVEDDPEIQTALMFSLKRVGFNVKICSHGLEALNVIKDNVFSLMITDLEMPVMNGYVLIKSIHPRKMPIIVHSGSLSLYSDLDQWSDAQVLKSTSLAPLMDEVFRLLKLI